MKRFAHHDTAGNITGLVSFDAPKDIVLMLAPKPGILVSEIEDFKGSDAPLPELRSVVRDLRVPMGARARLEKAGK